MVLVGARQWPDTFDLMVVVYCMAIFLGGPLVGYYFLACDIRKHLRRFRHALVLVSNYVQDLPEWVGKRRWSGAHVPPCLAALGLSIPFTEQELLEAYRDRVKQAHPDRGGSPDAFLQLQRHFEEARSLLGADTNGVSGL
jgi:hypothetical protein